MYFSKIPYNITNKKKLTGQQKFMSDGTTLVLNLSTLHIYIKFDKESEDIDSLI